MECRGIAYADKEQLQVFIKENLQLFILCQDPNFVTEIYILFIIGL